MSLISIHQAIYSALTGSTALMAICKGVYDVPPEEADPPYLVIGEDQMVEGRLLNLSEKEVLVRINSWSKYAGRKETLQLEGLVRSALMTLGEFEDFDALQDPTEPEWWHGVLTMRFWDR